MIIRKTWVDRKQSRLQFRFAVDMMNPITVGADDGLSGAA